MVMCVCCASKHNKASQVHNKQIALELSKFHFIQLEKRCALTIAMCLYMHKRTWCVAPSEHCVKVPVYFVNSYYILYLFSFINLIKKIVDSLWETFHAVFTINERLG